MASEDRSVGRGRENDSSGTRHQAKEVESASLQQSGETLLVLSDAVEQMLETDSWDTVVETALDAATDVLGYSQTGIHRYDNDEESLPPVTWSGELEADLGEPPALGVDSLAHDVYQSTESVVVEDYHDETSKHVNTDATIRSEVIVPIGEFGVLLSGSTRPDVFSELDKRFLEILCANASAAFDRIERVSRLEQREQEVQQQREMLSNLLSTLEDGFETVSTSTDSITEMSQSISTDTDRQVETLDDVGNNVEQLSVAMGKFAERANSARDVTEEAVTSFETAREMLDETQETVSEIEQAMVRANESFEELRDDVAEIDAVVEIINDIADQTNILALNAAVEASHADQDGAGFSVIAEEVKSLSEETAENTDQIESIAKTIDTRIEEMADRMETTRARTRRSVEDMGDVSDQFSSVVARVDEATSSVEKIAVEADQQATAIEQTSEALQRAERLSRSIASQTDEIADGTTEQSEKVAEMKTTLRETEAALVDDN